MNSPDITHDVRQTLIEGPGGELAIRHRMEVPDEYLEDLRSERLAKRAMRHTELNRVASVPAFVWDLWIRQGRDPHNATPKQITSWLERDNLGAFITARV